MQETKPYVHPIQCFIPSKTFKKVWFYIGCILENYDLTYRSSVELAEEFFREKEEDLFSIPGFFGRFDSQLVYSEYSEKYKDFKRVRKCLFEGNRQEGEMLGKESLLAGTLARDLICWEKLSISNVLLSNHRMEFVESILLLCET